MDQLFVEKLAQSLAARILPRLEHRNGNGNGIVPVLMDSKTCAAFLGLKSTRSLWHMKQRGLIPFVRINRKVMYERSRIEMWIVQHRED